MGKQGVAAGILTFLIGLVLFVDDLHDFVQGTDFLHFLPDFDPYLIFGFQLHHLYLGVLIMLIGLVVAVKYDD
jgi:hypothetical protein